MVCCSYELETDTSEPTINLPTVQYPVYMRPLENKDIGSYFISLMKPNNSPVLFAR